MATTITIAAADRTADILMSGLTISQVLTSQQDTMSFVVMSGTKPTSGQAVVVTEGSTILFGGIIDAVKADEQAGGITRWQCTARDYEYAFNAKLVTDIWENKTADFIVKDIIDSYSTGFTKGGVDSGAPVVEHLYCEYERPADVMKKLAEYVGWEWYIDYNKDVQFFDPATRNDVAPIQLTDNTDIRNWKHNIDEVGLANRVYVLGGSMYSDPATFEFIADGVQTVFPLGHKPHNLSMTVNAVAVTVGIENVDEDDGTHDYFMNYQEKYVKNASATAAIAAGTTVAFTYQYDIPVITMAEDVDSQTAVKAVQGGDGIYEYKIKDDALVTIEAAKASGDAYLREHANARVTGTFSTAQAGWVPGQILTVNSASRGISGIFTIQKVRIAPYGTSWLYTIDYGGRLYGIEDRLRALISAQQASRSQDTVIINKIKGSEESVSITDSSTTTINSDTYLFDGADALWDFAVFS